MSLKMNAKCNFSKLEQQLQKIQNVKMKAEYGIPAENNKNNAAMCLAVNTYGSPEKNIPPRDAIKQPVADKKQEVANTYRAQFKKEAQKNTNMKQVVSSALNTTCFTIIEDIVKPTILSNGNGNWPELKPATKKNKKDSSQMLIETGNMFDCLGWKVYDK